ncbi:UNVERIFIED_CONTAM: hypothetical protein GTU68_039831, partial [Idotea baltica]|nr:hypothetical protein [Idotea baltica]
YAARRIRGERIRCGCFWYVEAVFQELKGVVSVTSGYTGGQIAYPSYNEVASGQTGHAEVTRIIYDPGVISLDDLFEVFWATHNPTTLNRRGNDQGTQYRSGIWYTSSGHKMAALNSNSNVAPSVCNDAITTEIAPLGDFYPAEEYHQNYFLIIQIKVTAWAS